MKNYFFFVLIVTAFSCAKSDPNFKLSDPKGSVQLIQTFGGSKNDLARSVVATKDGGFAVVGCTQSTDGDVTDKTSESYDLWVLKFDSECLLQWSRTYGGSGDDRGSDLIQTSDGFAVLGYTDSLDGDVTTSMGHRDFWLLKTEVDGALSWQKAYGYSGADEGISLIETPEKDFILSGVLDVTASGGSGNLAKSSKRHAGGDYWSIKVSSLGTLIWARSYGGSLNERPFGIAQNSKGELVVVGSSDSSDADITSNKGSYDFWIVKSDATGHLLWEASYGGAEIDVARGIISSEDGNYVIVGDTRSNQEDVSFNNGAADLWLIKISEDGTLLWNRSIGGTNFDVARSLYKTYDDGFVISGSSRSSDGDVAKNQGQNDAWIVKTNNKGELLWEATVGGTNIDFAYDAVQLTDGSIIAVGDTNSFDGDIPQNKGLTDALIIKIK